MGQNIVVDVILFCQSCTKIGFCVIPYAISFVYLPCLERLKSMW